MEIEAGEKRREKTEGRKEKRQEDRGALLKLRLVGGHRHRRFQEAVVKKVDSRIPVVPRLRSAHLAGEACDVKAQ